MKRPPSGQRRTRKNGFGRGFSGWTCPSKGEIIVYDSLGANAEVRQRSASAAKAPQDLCAEFQLPFEHLARKYASGKNAGAEYVDHMWIVCGSYVDPCSSKVVCQFKVMLQVLVCKEDCLIMFDIIIFIRFEYVFPQGHVLASRQLQFMDLFSRVGRLSAGRRENFQRGEGTPFECNRLNFTLILDGIWLESVFFA